MSDDIDHANESSERQLTLAIAKRKPFSLDEGKPGDCEICGYWFGRLVDGACVPCRHKYEKRH